MIRQNNPTRNKPSLLWHMTGVLALLIVAGCGESHQFVDKIKSHAEESQHAMRAMNLYEQAKQNYLSGNLLLAERKIEESIQLKGDVADALVLRLQILIDMNRNAEVLEAAAAGTKAAPKDPRFPYYTGIFYERAGKTAEALICFKEAALIAPSAVQYKLAAAEMMMEQEQYLLAENYLKRAARQHPNAPGLLQTLGALAEIRGQDRKAVVYFSEALALAPTARPLQENMAKACVSVGDYFKALHYLEPLLAEPGMEPRRDLQSLAVQCYLKCNRPLEARQLLRKLVQDPGKATYGQLRQMVDSAVLLADWPLLNTAATQMISVKPKAVAGHLAMAVYQEQNGDKTAAWKTLEDYKGMVNGNVSPLLLKYQEQLK